MSLITLYYVHDPMCSWCYAFQHSLSTIKKNLPSNVCIKTLLGGLAADSNVPMPAEMQEYVKQNWQRIESVVTGVKFNYAFWDVCMPKRSTYPACRAVIAARNQDISYEDKMVQAIQNAYYQEARNPSEQRTLIELANEIGLSNEKFEQDLTSDSTNETLISEMNQARAMKANSYPSLVIEKATTFALLEIDYNDPSSMLKIINTVSNNN